MTQHVRPWNGQSMNPRFQTGHRTRVHYMWRKAPLLLRPSVRRQTDHLAQNVPSGKSLSAGSTLNCFLLLLTVRGSSKEQSTKVPTTRSNYDPIYFVIPLRKLKRSRPGSTGWGPCLANPSEQHYGVTTGQPSRLERAASPPV